jgi:hypothetical protein
MSVFLQAIAEVDEVLEYFPLALLVEMDTR